MLHWHPAPNVGLSGHPGRMMGCIPVVQGELFFISDGASFAAKTLNAMSTSFAQPGRSNFICTHSILIVKHTTLSTNVTEYGQQHLAVCPVTV